MISGLLDIFTGIMLKYAFFALLFQEPYQMSVPFVFFALNNAISVYFLSVSFQPFIFKYTNIYSSVIKHLSAKNIDNSVFSLYSTLFCYLCRPQYQTVGKKEFVNKTDNKI